MSDGTMKQLGKPTFTLLSTPEIRSIPADYQELMQGAPINP